MTREHKIGGLAAIGLARDGSRPAAGLGAKDRHCEARGDGRRAENMLRRHLAVPMGSLVRNPFFQAIQTMTSEQTMKLECPTRHICRVQGGGRNRNRKRSVKLKLLAHFHIPHPCMRREG